MALEILFGTGLGDLRQRAEDTVIAYRSNVDLPEYSLEACARGLHELLAGMARDSSVFALSPEGQEFYFLAIVRPPTLGLEVDKQVLFTVRRVAHLSIPEQMDQPAREIAATLADLGTPRWIDPSQPREPAHLPDSVRLFA